MNPDDLNIHPVTKAETRLPKNQLKTDSHEYITVVSSEIYPMHEWALSCLQDTDVENDFLPAEPRDLISDINLKVVTPIDN